MESFVLGWRIGKEAGSEYSIYKACKWVLVGRWALLQGLQWLCGRFRVGFAKIEEAVGRFRLALQGLRALALMFRVGFATLVDIYGTLDLGITNFKSAGNKVQDYFCDACSGLVNVEGRIFKP